MSRILIVDDEQGWRDAYRRLFRATPYHIEIVADGVEAIEKAPVFKPDIVLLDVMMPGVDGYAVCENLLQIDELKGVEVIFVSSKGKLDDRLKAYTLRASDYIVKPFANEELLAKIELLIERRHYYHEMASIDALTQLGNRHSFEKKFRNVFDLSAKFRTNFTLAIADIDFFKAVNDTHGHDVGDFILQQVANRLHASLGENGVVTRIGGEEFAFLFPGLDRSQVLSVLEDCRADIESHVFQKPDADAAIRVTVSIGLAEYPFDTMDKKQLFCMADNALYAAKDGGRNRVQSHDTMDDCTACSAE